MTLPITLNDVNNKITEEISEYYRLKREGASQDILENILQDITNLKSLRDSFSDNSEYFTLKAQSYDSFINAINENSSDNIISAFNSYSNLESYIKNNIVNFNSSGVPIFSSNSKTLFNDNGERVIIGDPES